MDELWPDVSPAVRTLIRQGAEKVLNPPMEWVLTIQDAAFAGVRMAAIADDPALAEGTRRTNYANTMQWAASNVARPGERVPIQFTPEILTTARDLVRRGLDESALDSFRTAQSAALRMWMNICFTLTDDPVLLRELLDVTSLSISTFIDDTVAAMSERMRAERKELARGTHAERRAAIALLLEGAPIPLERAEAQLGYRLNGSHTAIVLWRKDDDALDAGPDLEGIADLVTQSAGGTGGLSVVASASSWWMWLPADGIGEPDLSRHPGVRIAVGRPGTGVKGFRDSHFQALSAQRVLSRLGTGRRIVRFDEIRLISLLDTDHAAVDDFVADTLGDLATADHDLQTTVRTWIRLQCNTARTAESLFTHRNTVIRRLSRADELLPRPLTDNLVDIAVSLEVLHWRS